MFLKTFNIEAKMIFSQNERNAYNNAIIGMSIYCTVRNLKPHILGIILVQMSLLNFTRLNLNYILDWGAVASV